MPSLLRARLILASALSLPILLAGTAAAQPEGVPVHALEANAAVREWLVLGPFPNPELTNATTVATRAAFGRDDLLALGGETNAVLVPGIESRLPPTAGAPAPRTVTARADRRDYIDLVAALEGTNSMSAYAFTYVAALSNQTAWFHLGSDDSAKVWVNGRLAHSAWTRGREARPWSENFAAPLVAGLNPLLVKVENSRGGWGFYLEVYQAATNELHQFARDARNHLMFPDELGIRPVGGHVFPAGRGPPRLVWKNHEFATAVYGPLHLTVRWFDARHREVTDMEEPGRYIGMAESTTARGLPVRRALTCFAYPPEWREAIAGSTLAVTCAVPSALTSPVSSNLLALAAPDMASAANAEWKGSQAQALWLAQLYETRETTNALRFVDSPRCAALDSYVALKRSLLGLAERYPGLKPPRAPARPAASLQPAASPPSAAFDEVRDACRQWHDAEKEPFNVCVAKRGQILFHEAFGTVDGKPATLATPFWAASASKAVTGLLFGRFVDQGIFAPDAPLGCILPDWPASGPAAVTFRDCFVHLHGYNQRYQVGGGIDEPWYENNVAWVEPYCARGAQQTYSGTGFRLAAKAMELASGKSFYRLVQEDLFDPLGLNDSRPGEPDGGMWFSARDLATIGTVFINRGACGNVELLGTNAFNQLLPTALHPLYPAVNGTNGLGLWWMALNDRFARPVAGPRMIGHGAASGTLLRADLDSGLVIALARGRSGRDYDTFALRFLEAVNRAVR